MNGNSGFAHVVAIIVVAGLIIGAVAYKPIFQNIEKQTNLHKTNETTSQLSTVSTQTATPTISPTLTLTPSPTLTPTLTPTLAPTKAPMTPTPVVVTKSGPPGAGHSRYTIATDKGSFLIDVVSINMSGVRMITDTANDGECADNCATLPLSEYVSRNGGFAGINGTYFCPTDYADCQSKKNSFDFPVYNSRLGRWINQGNIAWNNRSIFYKDGGGLQFKATAADFGGGLEAGLVNHPGLLDGGNVIAENFGQSEKQMSKGTKTGIGKNGNTVYLVVARNVNMVDLAYVFKSLGATHALNLDGGGSVALWYNGYKVGPGRSLPNAVVFAY